jgi:hypothetical protein
VRSTRIAAVSIALGMVVLGAAACTSTPAPTPSPSPPPAEPVTFTASGDFNDTRAAKAVFAGIHELEPDFHVALGDLSYGDPGEEEAWCDLVTKTVGAAIPFQLLAGNHESDGSDGDIDVFADCLPNRLPGLEGTYAKQYYVDVPEKDPVARLVLISPGLDFPDGRWSYEKGGDRYDWTKEAIENAHDAGIPWVVVAMHKPCISMGEYECDPGQDILDLLVEERVDLVLTGHEHLYQRTAQLDTGRGCSALRPGEYSAECVADDDDQLQQGEGTVFVTVGTGGQGLRGLNPDDPEAPYFVATEGDAESGTHGSLEVKLTPGKLAARFVPADKGEFRDAFTIDAAQPTG